MSIRAMGRMADVQVIEHGSAVLPRTALAPRTAERKLLQLESIRGLASFAVVFHHAIQCFYPLLFSLPNASLPPGFQWVAATPLRVACAGRFAVELFFVLSGFVLSYSYFKKQDSIILVSGALRRYFRLALPITGSVLLAYLLMLAGGMHAAQAAAVVPYSFLGIAYNFQPTLSTALIQGATATFYTEPVTTNYNIVLWTMRTEFIGSMLVYGLLASVGRFRLRWLAYGPVIVLAEYWDSQLTNFILGTALCDLYVNWSGFKEARNVVWRLCILLICGAALYMGSYGRPGVFYPSAVFGLTTRWWTIGAFLLIAGALVSPDLSRFLVRAPLVWLGKVSFSLYLTHLSVLASAGAFTCWQARKGGWSETSAILLTVGVTVVCSLLLAGVFYRLVEEPSLKFAKWFGNAVTGRIPFRRLRTLPAEASLALASVARTTPSMLVERGFVALLGCAIGVGCAGFLGLAWVRGLEMDLQAHVRMIVISIHSGSWPPNFLYYWTVAACAGFSPDTNHLMLSTIAVLGASCGLRFLVCVWAGCKFLGELPGWSQRPGLRYAFYIAVALLQVTHNIIDLHQPNTYIGYFPANVWHNSTMIFLMPWAILMFYFAWRSLTRCRPGDLWMLALLGVVNVAIKNSFVLALVPVMTVATLLLHRVSWKTLRIGLALVPPVAFIALQTLMIYSPFFADSVLARYHQKMGVSGESRIAFEFLALWPPHTLSTILCSFLYPITLLVLFPRRFATDRLVWFSAACLAVAMAIYMCLVETGFRRLHGNFTWQVLVCTHLFFLVCILFQFREILQRCPAEQRQPRDRDLIPAVPYALHVICGLLYMGMFVIARSGR